ncbi:MAG: hypothetical protein UU73_C0001G0216 [Candidatus Daviesbacteria bacterium GW2011_GWA1_41_61]|uniref:Uncharacterized protein n=1 Tax=Candidatus Daviesbacteria bacterium GW2011_GWA2_40_9 TaxID=1618424 RepID=A0A0G0U0C9_9BACT|nr:MAG: hypothetical protein UU26_C0017G0012 [Candidatus Daviesbacteria bacterium GW2011_GWC1_40_9]KKR82584.1 MAG: hypothetical protein UU29_C0011G0031 [Candidatus Daviesbacteria bacterium GW2011_GWA2_40_9]KKR93035.1 MAG: hypothetical protein UU44_C0004G0217 [Candidatus Daviesbacteria bacterium GW2011_GWB1_41_15]KKS15579.1 MAG: hypothetical protein UU73_C0001G0216 [Candidatus Daviesbacteria bacterium GW2011_GWA1_41_61]
MKRVNRLKIPEIDLMTVIFFTVPIFIFTLFAYRFSPQIQFQIFTLAAIIYVIVALVHHHKDKSLTLEIIIEYVLIAALALIILQGLLF